MDWITERADGFTLVAALCFWGMLPWAQRLDPDSPPWLSRAAWLCLLTAPWLLARPRLAHPARIMPM